MDDLVGVTDHSEVRIVGDDNDLPTLLCILNRRHQDIRYCLVIKIFLWLIDDEWDVAHINQQIKDQQEVTPLTGRKLVERFTLPS